MDEFYRIKRLPPYVFTIVSDLKSKAAEDDSDLLIAGTTAYDANDAALVEPLVELVRPLVPADEPLLWVGDAQFGNPVQ